jgi:Ceramidase
MGKILKLCVPAGLALLAAGWGLFAPPLAQSQAYHHFADTRVLLSIANAADTLSNLAFLLVGALGLAFLWRERAQGGSGRFASPREMRPWWVFFAGMALTSVGSGWYHLAPGDARLVWDRLPMTIAFMSLLAAMVSERVSVRAGNLLLAPLVVLGIASVAWWRWSALAGFENLRPYMAVQFGSIAVIVSIAALYRSRYTHGGAIFALAAVYGVAKLLESFDREIYGALGHLASGHTLKHLAAAAGVYLLLLSLQRRRPRWAAVSPPS